MTDNKSGMANKRKEPRWVVSKSPSGRVQPAWVPYFLRALERTGEARTAAKDAGIDHTTAYARRKAHSDFAAAWAAALAAHEARVKAEEDAEIEALNSGHAHPSPGSPRIKSGASPTSPLEGRGADGAELVVSGGKVRRVGYGRWSKAKEKIFFETLAATASLRRAADAIGMSTNAILARRQRSRLFAAKFDFVVEKAKVVIDLYLVEEAKKTFDPEQLETDDVSPGVTIDQAIKISQRSGSKTRRAETEFDPFAEGDQEEDGGEGVEAVKASIIGKLSRIRDADRREQLKLGWTLDESFDVMIPPGWIKGPDYNPKPPELPVDYYSNYRGVGPSES